MAGARAQSPQQFEGRTIASIQFSPASSRWTGRNLRSILPLKIRAPLRMEDVRETITRLWATLAYTDIQIDAEPAGEQVLIRILTENRWFVARVAAGGSISDPPNTGQLVNGAGLNLGELYSDEKLARAKDSLQRLMTANGLYHAGIEPRYTYDAERQQVNLTFVVSSGTRAKFTRPELEGGDLKLPPEKIISATKWRRWLPLRWIEGTWKEVTQTRVRNGLDSVAALYQKDERLESRVSLGDITYDEETNTVRPTIDITAGPKVSIKTVGFNISGKKLRDYIPVYEERTVDRDLLVEGQRNLTDYLQGQGFFDAEVHLRNSASSTIAPKSII